jgi:hypothetical protein
MSATRNICRTVRSEELEGSEAVVTCHIVVFALREQDAQRAGFLCAGGFA